MSALLLAASLLGILKPIVNVPELDYQASIARGANSLVVVFERLDYVTFYGDLYAMHSFDNGATWSAPVTVVATASNERAPALVFDGTQFILFHIGDGYRIYRETSPDGVVWTNHGPVDLGWSTTGEINPDVIREADGTLTMTYHRQYGGSYIAQSHDGGATWDTRRTAITDTSSALPRITKRESDGLYVATYQINPGNNALQLYSKTTHDPYDWSAPASPLATGGNDHDSAPHVLPNGTFGVIYAEQKDFALFGLLFRTSVDGRTWSAPTPIERYNPMSDDVQPHLLDADGRSLVMVWSCDLNVCFDRVELTPPAKRRSAR